MNSKSIGVTVAICVVVVGAAATGYWLGTSSENGGQRASPANTAEREPLYYRHPMNPEVTSDVPKKGSMGMDYIPVYADEIQGAGSPGSVQIDPVTVQNIGVRTAKAVQRNLSHTIKTVGRVDYDERRLVQLHPKTEGWVEELFVKTTGAPVRANSMLLSLYSPQLVSTQQEYVLALRNLETLRKSPFEDVRTGAEELVKTTEERLRLLDVPDHQIDNLKKTLTVRKNLHITLPPTVLSSGSGPAMASMSPLPRSFTLLPISAKSGSTSIFMKTNCPGCRSAIRHASVSAPCPAARSRER